MVSKLKKKSFIFALALILLPISPPARAVDGPRTKCNIRVDDPHISKSIRREKGFDAVKVNARSKCNLAMSNLRLTVEIRKQGFLRSYLVRETTLEVTNLIPAEVPLRNKKTWIKCKSARPSHYFGVAYATAKVLGRKVRTERVLSENTVSLPCGT